MPHATAYRRGFRLRTGTNIEGYKITSITIKHVMKERYHYYTYPTRIVFHPIDDQNKSKLLRYFKSYVNKKRIIYSAYGNPYKCDFQGEKSITSTQLKNGDIVVKCEGSAIRVY